MTFKQSFVEVDGCRINLRRGGSGEPLLFLHGASGAPAILPFMERLAQRFDVLVPEHPGFGLSDEPAWLDKARTPATEAAARPAPRPAAAMMLCPQACPMAGSASYSQQTAMVGPLVPAVARKAVSRPYAPRSTARPADSFQMPIRRLEIVTASSAPPAIPSTELIARSTTKSAAGSISPQSPLTSTPASASAPSGAW